MSKMFRVMGMRSIPWEMVAPYEQQARANHDQSLERLNERGGLDVGELWCVVHGKPLRELRGRSRDEFEAWFGAWVKEYEQNDLRAQLATVTAERDAALARAEQAERERDELPEQIAAWLDERAERHCNELGNSGIAGAMDGVAAMIRAGLWRTTKGPSR